MEVQSDSFDNVRVVLEPIQNLRPRYVAAVAVNFQIDRELGR